MARLATNRGGAKQLAVTAYRFHLHHRFPLLKTHPRRRSPLTSTMAMLTHQLTEEQLREVVQGPTEVEWRCVELTCIWVRLFHPFSFASDTKCVETVKRSCQVSFLAHFKSQSRWKPCSNLVLHTCASIVHLKSRSC